MDQTIALRPQALAQAEPIDPAIGPADVMDYDPNEGFDNVQIDDFQIRRWSLVQFSSRMPGKAEHLGEFFCSLDGSFRPTLDLVVLRMHPSRALFGGGNQRAPECSSDDGQHGTVHGACARCKFNPQFNATLAAQIKSGEPAKNCKGGYTYLTSEAWSGNLALITISGSSAAVGRRLNGALRALARGMFSVVVRLSTVKTVNDKGEFFTLAYQIVEEFPVSVAREFYNVSKSMAGVKLRAADDADEVAAPATIPTGPSVNAIVNDEAIPF